MIGLRPYQRSFQSWGLQAPSNNAARQAAWQADRPSSISVSLCRAAWNSDRVLNISLRSDYKVSKVTTRSWTWWAYCNVQAAKISPTLAARPTGMFPGVPAVRQDDDWVERVMNRYRQRIADKTRIGTEWVTGSLVFFLYVLHLCVVPELSLGGRLWRILWLTGRICFVFVLLYFFICSLDVLQDSFQLLGGRIWPCAIQSSAKIMIVLV